MEILDVVDENGNPTGETVDRVTAHAQGIRHRTSHVWVYRMENGRMQVLLQKRCKDKDSFGGFYDTSSAGHIPAGCGFEESALRELEEELGVIVKESDLEPLGFISVDWDDEFHGKPFLDRQVSKVFRLRLDGYEEKDFVCQPSEVEAVKWMDYEEAVCAIRDNTIKHCIGIDEFLMIGCCQKA